MATEIFKKGDIVQLKSGGPYMTVADVEGGEAGCTWFNKDNELKSNDFDIELLNKIEQGDSSSTFRMGSNPKRNNSW